MSFEMLKSIISYCNFSIKIFFKYFFLLKVNLFECLYTVLCYHVYLDYGGLITLVCGTNMRNSTLNAMVITDFVNFVFFCLQCVVFLLLNIWRFGNRIEPRTKIMGKKNSLTFSRFHFLYFHLCTFPVYAKLFVILILLRLHKMI